MLRYSSGQWFIQLLPIDLPLIQGLPSEASQWQLLARSDEATLIKLLTSDGRPAPAALRAPSAPALRLYRASTKKWEPLEVAGPDPRIRLIGQWLLMAAGEEKKGRTEPLGKAEHRQLPDEGRLHPERLRRPDTTGRFNSERPFIPARWLYWTFVPGRVGGFRQINPTANPFWLTGLRFTTG